MADTEISPKALQTIQNPNLTHEQKVEWIKKNTGTQSIDCFVALSHWEATNKTSNKQAINQPSQLSYDDLYNLAAHLQQIFKEKQNAKNGMRPKKQHPGYKFDGEFPAQKKGTPRRRFKYITTYPNSFNYEAALAAVTLDFNNGLLMTMPGNIPYDFDLMAGNKGLYELQITIDKKDRNTVSIPDTVRYFELKTKKKPTNPKGQKPPVKKKNTTPPNPVAGVVATPHNDGGYCWACPNCGTGWHNSTSQKGSVFTSTCKKCNHTYSVSCAG